MKLTTTEAKKRHSINYVEYVETQFYYQCVTCATVVEHEMGHCKKCYKELNPNNRQQLFCCECEQPIIHKRDYFINEKHFVLHYPVNYLACQCPENLWVPFIKGYNSSIPTDPTTGVVTLTVDNIYVWDICCAEPSQYSNNEDIYFINDLCQLTDCYFRFHKYLSVAQTKKQCTPFLSE